MPSASQAAGRDGGDAEAGRGHQRLLRAGGDDVDPPLVGLERNGAEARDRVDDDERAGRPRGGGERLEVDDDAGGRLGMRQEDGLRTAELLEAGGEVVRARRLAPLVLDGLDVGAVRRRELLPALAERAGGDDDHAVAGRAEVRDGRLHRPGAGAGEEQDVVRGAAHLPEPLERLAEELLVVGPAVVEHRLGERGQHFRRHRRRPRGEQIALVGHALAA